MTVNWNTKAPFEIICKRLCHDCLSCESFRCACCKLCNDLLSWGCSLLKSRLMADRALIDGRTTLQDPAQTISNYLQGTPVPSFVDLWPQITCNPKRIEKTWQMNLKPEKRPITAQSMSIKNCNIHVRSSQKLTPLTPLGSKESNS